MNQTEFTPGVRHDHATDQYFPTVGGVDVSPSSFDRDRALQIAREESFRRRYAELCENADKHIRAYLSRALKSGAIDLESAGDDFIVPLAVLCAAFRDASESFRYSHPAIKKDADNIYRSTP